MHLHQQILHQGGVVYILDVVSIRGWLLLEEGNLYLRKYGMICNGYFTAIWPPNKSKKKDAIENKFTIGMQFYASKF